MAPGDMFFIEHLNELRNRFIRVIIFAIAIVIFSSVFGIQLITINNYSFYFIYPAVYNNIASQITLFLSHNLLPEGVEINSDCPGQSLFAQIYVSFLLGIAGTIPLIVKEIFGFIGPAISKKTKKTTIFRLYFPITIFFLLGIFFLLYCHSNNTYLFIPIWTVFGNTFVFKHQRIYQFCPSIFYCIRHIISVAINNVYFIINWFNR